MRGYLVFGACWLVASTLVIYRLPAVRDFVYADEPVESAAAAATA
jgi:hypothetical protein